MNKFRQVRQKQQADKEQAELFADTMDMIARERAVIKLYDGKQSLAVNDLSHAVNLINEQLEHEYNNMMKNTTVEEMTILHDGITVLINGFKYSNELDTELAKELQDPERFKSYQAYIKHLLRVSKLETIVKVLGNFKK